MSYDFFGLGPWGFQIYLSEDINILLSEYQVKFDDHPMTTVLRAGLSKSTNTGRRGGRSGRL